MQILCLARQARVALALLALLIFPVVAFGQEPLTEAGAELKHTGTVESRPEEEVVGRWAIGHRMFEVSAETEFEGDVPEVGDCVEVEYAIVNGNNHAQEIAPSTDCADEGEGGGEDEESHEARGRIKSFPAELVGLWEIGDAEYTATEETEFEQSDGPFDVGVCVEVEFTIQEGQNVAISIKTEDDCGDHGDKEIAVAIGRVTDLPEGDTFVGTWSISDTTYAVTDETELETRRGEFYVGACVKVLYHAHSATREAVGIATMPAAACGELPAPPLPAPVLKATGLITDRPEDGLFGTWTIGGVEYEAIEGTTVFDQEEGALALNTCAEVRYQVDAYGEEGMTKIALKIESEAAHECGEASEEHKVYGIIRALPETEDLIGTWTIGGREYEVTAETELADGPFTVGLLVKVKYVRGADGALVAVEIEGKRRVDHQDRERGKSRGVLNTLPESDDLLGTWTIGGVDYIVTESTKLRPEDAAWDADMCVEVYYHLVESERHALRIKAEPAEACSRDPQGRGVGRAYGHVELMPPTGFIGTWRIGGVVYDAQASSQFEASHGDFVVGAFVKVLYRVVDGVNVVHKMKTHVPPGAGDVDDAGKLRIGEGTRAPRVAEQMWTIGGTAYLITDATMLDDSQADFMTGQLVTVNAYEDAATGSLVATEVTARTTNLHLPVLFRNR